MRPALNRKLPALLLAVALLAPLAACSQKQAVYQPAVAKLIERASALKNSNQLDQAICRLEAAADLAPDVFQVQYNLGIVYTEANRPLQAMPHLKQAVALNPNDANAHYALGIAAMAWRDMLTLAEKAKTQGDNLKDLALPPEALALSPAEIQTQRADATETARQAFAAFLKYAPQQDPARAQIEAQLQTLH